MDTTLSSKVPGTVVPLCNISGEQNLHQTVSRTLHFKNTIVTSSVYHFTRVGSKIWKNFDRILYIIKEYIV